MSARTSPTEPWLDDLAEGVVLIRDGRVRRINRAAAELLGTDADGAVGRAPIAVLRDHRLERVWLEGTPVDLVLRGRRVRAVPIDGGIALRDVSDAHRAREGARELLAVLSHELRTPLTTVHATLEALGYADLPAEDRARLLERATGEAERLRRLVDDLTVDAAPPRERSVSVAESVERALALLAPILRERRVRVVARAGEATAWVDPDKLLQVLLNLIQNAAVHGPAGGTVHVDAGEEGGTVRITVRDEGTPLPPERLERIFEPRARAAAGRRRGGGLGLYVVRKVAGRWGGHAWGGTWRGPSGAGARAGVEFGVTAPATRATARECGGAGSDGGTGGGDDVG